MPSNKFDKDSGKGYDQVGLFQIHVLNSHHESML